MSSTPEVGEDGALEDAIDLPEHDIHGSEEDDQQSSAPAHFTDGIEGVPVLDSPEHHDVGQGQEAGSLNNEDGAISLRQNIRDDLHSEEDTVSIPDDTPSIQVLSKRLKVDQPAKTHRALLHLLLVVKHLPSSALAPVQARPAYIDHSIADFSLASQPHL